MQRNAPKILFFNSLGSIFRGTNLAKVALQRENLGRRDYD